jgi:protein-tyrosine phosphatase
VADDVVHILVVCTANQCRSPLTAAALEQRASVRGLPVVVTSAGTTAVPGLAATPPTLAAASARGLDLERHSSAPLEHEAVRQADLIIGLERRHVQDIVVQDPRAFPKAYTLKELVRRGDQVGPRPSTVAVHQWLLEVHRGRQPRDLLGVSATDDITDPTGSDAVDHHTTAAEVDELAGQVLELLFGGPGG